MSCSRSSKVRQWGSQDLRLAGGKVDVVPGKSEQLAASQPEDEHQDVAGVQRVVIATRGLEELTSLGDTPDRELLRGTGTRTRPATFRVTSSSLMAALSALRRTVHA